MQLVIRPKGALYIFGMVLLYVFFSLFPIGGGLILIFEPVAADSSVPPAFYLCFIIEIPFYILITIDIIRYKILISDDEIIINSNKTCIDMLFKKDKKKYRYVGLKSIQLKKGVVPFEGYTVKYVLKYDKSSQTLDLSRFSRKQVATIKNAIIERAQKVNNEEVQILETSDKILQLK